MTRHVLFDLSFVPAPGETAETAHELMEQVRRIGVKRFLFASDYNVLTPEEEIKYLGRLGLTKEEWQALRENCAPWAC